MSDVGVLVSLDEAEVEKSKVVLDYTSRDFTAIRSQLIGLAKGLMPDWVPASEPSDFGTLLLELFAYMGDVMHFYIDRTAAEAFLSTAVRYNSVLYIADMMGYTPIGQSSAIVTVTFKLDDEATESVTLPTGTRVHNGSGDAETVVVFELQNSVTLEAIEPTAENPTPRQKSVMAMEGVTVKDFLVGTATGVPNLDFALPEKGVIYRSVSVITREGYQTIRWDYVTDLSLGRPTQPIFTTYIDEANVTHIVFGDNAAGRIPSVNADVFATYRFGVGAAANLLEANSIDTIIPPPDIEGMEFVTVWNDSAPVGGSDPESIESMKHSIPRSAGRIKNRAVTLNDYADLALQVPGVAKSVAYGTVYTAVRVKFGLSTPNGEAAPEVMTRYCREIEAYMADKILIGSSVYAEPENSDDLWSTPTDGTAEIYIRVLVHVVETYNRTAVREQVETVLRKLLDYTTVTFGTRISIGTVYRTILGVQGVEWAELKWLSTEAPPQDIPRLGSGELVTPLFAGNWDYSNNNTIANPTAHHYRLNDPDNATHLAITKVDANDVDHGAQLLGLEIGDQILTRPTTDTDSWRAYIVDVVPTDAHAAEGWVDLTIHKANEAGVVDNPHNNDNVLFDFLRSNPSPDTILQVYDIQTPELLIPRIEPTVVVEELTQFPNMTEDERTHDGLWLWAVGGLANT
jgi:hypothetical protein